MRKSNYKEEIKPMFSDEFLEKIFANPEMQKIPIGAQSTAVKAFEEVLEDIQEVNPYVNLSELFTANGISANGDNISTEF